MVALASWLLLHALAGLALFTLGGLTGVVLANGGVDVALHDASDLGYGLVDWT